jgi:LysR family transcriptional regulator for metE and metH
LVLERQHLTILREVNRLGSVTAAAERLNVTQPALSHLIRKLEERNGIKIWMKHGRSLRLTQAGEYLLSLAERILPQLEHGERVLADYASGRRGALRVGMECHPCQKWLMRVTAPYLTAWPDVDFELRTAFPLTGINALANYEIALLISLIRLSFLTSIIRPCSIMNSCWRSTKATHSRKLDSPFHLI